MFIPTPKAKKKSWIWILCQNSLTRELKIRFVGLVDVLDEIWDVIESVSEGFLTYSSTLEVIHL